MEINILVISRSIPELVVLKTEQISELPEALLSNLMWTHILQDWFIEAK